MGIVCGEDQWEEMEGSRSISAFSGDWPAGQHEDFCLLNASSKFTWCVFSSKPGIETVQRTWSTNIEPEFVLMIQITSNLVCLAAPSEQDSVVTVVSNAHSV